MQGVWQPGLPLGDTTLHVTLVTPAGSLMPDMPALPQTQNVRQTTSTIKQVMQAAAAQPEPPAPVPAPPAPAAPVAAPPVVAVSGGSGGGGNLSAVSALPMAPLASPAGVDSASAFRDAVSLMQQQALASALASGQLTVAHAVSLPTLFNIGGGSGNVAVNVGGVNMGVGGGYVLDQPVLHIYPLSLDQLPR